MIDLVLISSETFKLDGWSVIQQPTQIVQNVHISILKETGIVPQNPGAAASGTFCSIPSLAKMCMFSFLIGIA